MSPFRPIYLLLAGLTLEMIFCFHCLGQNSPSYAIAQDTAVNVGGESVQLKAGQIVQVMQATGDSAIISVPLSDGSIGAAQIKVQLLKLAGNIAPPQPHIPSATPAPQITSPPITPQPTNPPEANLKTVTYDCTIPVDADSNCSQAKFRIWTPLYDKSVRGIIVLSAGTDGDARGWVNDRPWQGFAQKYRMAVIGTFFKSKENRDYTLARYGAGKALLLAITQFTSQVANHPELDQAPELLYGISAGGEFDYNFAIWKPDRTIAFVVNKGAYYDQTPPSSDALAVPGLFFLGLKDEKYRIDGITQVWTAGRKSGAPWGLACQPNSGHEFSKTAPVARIFFDALVKNRLPDDNGLPSTDAPVLKSIDATGGWVGDLSTLEIQETALASNSGPTESTAWFPDQATAQAWKEFVNPASAQKH